MNITKMNVEIKISTLYASSIPLCIHLIEYQANSIPDAEGTKKAQNANERLVVDIAPIITSGIVIPKAFDP